MKTTNIYVLIDPETQQVRYVGKANDISQRYKAHLNRARKHQIHKLNWINSLKKKGLKPILEVIDVVSIDEWIFWETYWIAQFKTWGFNLINYTQGGDGCTFGNQTSFKKGNTSWNKNKGNICICKVCNKKFKASVSNKRKFCSQECSTINKSLNLNSGTFKTGQQVWNKGRKGYTTSKRKKVIQLTLDNIFIKEFDSVKEASEEVGCGRANIENVCRGVSKTAKNFKWKYKENYERNS